jgi:hypothetical protein
MVPAAAAIHCSILGLEKDFTAPSYLLQNSWFETKDTLGNFSQGEGIFYCTKVLFTQSTCQNLK